MALWLIGLMGCAGPLLGDLIPDHGDFTLTITPATVAAQPGDTITVTFTASNVPLGVSTVTFGWTFGAGVGGTGSQAVAVVNRSASLSKTHTYVSAGAYGVSVSVSAGSVVRTSTPTPVVIGDVDERDDTVLTSCGSWSVWKEGSQGITIDRWIISDLPAGALFDLEYDAYWIPDRFLVVVADDPVFDSGWRGDELEVDDNPELYPGGWAGIGEGAAVGMFTRGSAAEFTVMVVGPDSGTWWKYRVQCRLP
jgi:hypothetical protein